MGDVTPPTTWKFGRVESEHRYGHCLKSPARSMRSTNPNYLKYVMSFDANGAGTGTVQRPTSIQPVASNIELRTIAYLPDVAASTSHAVQRAALSRSSAPIAADAAAIFGVAIRQLYSQPMPDEDDSNHQEHTSMAVEIVGTGWVP